VYHSSVSASHGSFPARRPFSDVFTMFAKSTSIPIPMISEPTDEIRLYAPTWPPLA
jgi:hypothetical protein